MRNKLFEKCSYVREVRDPVKTSTVVWTSLDERPPGYTLGDLIPARREKMILGRDDRERYSSIDVNDVEYRDPNKTGPVNRKDSPYISGFSR